MFSLEVTLILCLGFTFACFSSTSGEGTPIKQPTKAVTHYFQKVDNLDKRLKTPSAMTDLETIKYSIGMRSIRCDTKFLAEFRTEYEKLATISTKIATNFVGQIDTLLQSGLVGTDGARRKLCEYYRDDFLPRLTLDGEETKDAIIKASQKKLKDGVRELNKKICCQPGSQNSQSNLYINSVPVTSRGSPNSGSLLTAFCLGLKCTNLCDYLGCACGNKEQ